MGALSQWSYDAAGNRTALTASGALEPEVLVRPGQHPFGVGDLLAEDASAGARLSWSAPLAVGRYAIDMQIFAYREKWYRVRGVPALFVNTVAFGS